MNLFIDTHSKNLNIGLLKKEKLIDSVSMESNNSHSINTIYNIDLLFKHNNITPKDIDKIFVINGPGSFTGVRIGVTIAKTLAWTLNLPIIPLSSLELVALSTTKYDYVIPIIDAKRGFVYGAIYDKLGNIILEDQYIKLDFLKEKTNELDGSFKIISIEELEEINIEEIIKHHINDSTSNPHLINPNYLKKTEAEEKF